MLRRVSTNAGTRAALVPLERMAARAGRDPPGDQQCVEFGREANLSGDEEITDDARDLTDHRTAGQHCDRALERPETPSDPRVGASHSAGARAERMYGGWPIESLRPAGVGRKSA